MNDLLFSVHWYLPTLLAVVGIGLFVSGNRRQLPRPRNLGAALIVLALAWAMLSYFVDTDKEKVERGTRQLVADVVNGKWDQFQAALTPTVVFTVPNGVSPTGAAVVTSLARSGAETIKLESAHVQNLEIVQTGTLISVRCDVLSLQTLAGPQTTRWQFDWERTNEGWKVREIRPLAGAGLPMDELLRHLPMPRQ
ncbi:MAG TPA: DUF4440 domain-containing protein [Tepidisphaeraceae bacterium]|nr:DUF4440 domain-containing protein [Tepidisphaeraceae bacterium]